MCELILTGKCTQSRREGTYSPAAGVMRDVLACVAGVRVSGCVEVVCAHTQTHTRARARTILRTDGGRAEDTKPGLHLGAPAQSAQTTSTSSS